VAFLFILSNGRRKDRLRFRFRFRSGYGLSLAVELAGSNGGLLYDFQMTAA
jgi:hypothetical protein